MAGLGSERADDGGVVLDHQGSEQLRCERATPARDRVPESAVKDSHLEIATMAWGYDLISHWRSRGIDLADAHGLRTPQIIRVRFSTVLPRYFLLISELKFEKMFHRWL
jgi:hypothetical protein